MPSYPAPPVGVSPTGIDKTNGFNQPPPATHYADEGINHASGLSKVGLDSASNPLITAPNVTPIGTTTATVVWTTASLPGGTVFFRRASVGGTFQLYSEAAGPMTAHSAPLTGLTPVNDYEYRINQPGAAGSGGMSYYWGTFRTI